MNAQFRNYDPPEVWVPIFGWHHHEVSSRGQVRSLDRHDRNGQLRPGRILKQCDDGAGYLCVCLKHDGEQRHVRVHTLVARELWGRSPGQQVRHLDGNRRNNRFENLCWGDARENAADKERHGRQSSGDAHHSAKINSIDCERIGDLARAGTSHHLIANHLGIGQSSVSRILRGAQRRQPKTKESFDERTGTILYAAAGGEHGPSR